MLLAQGCLVVLIHIAPANLPRLNSIRLDPSVFGFTLTVSLVAGILFGLAPALLSARRDLAETIKESGRGVSGTGSQRLRRALVVSQIALALVLLVSSGLLLRSFAKLLNVPPGFDPNNVLTMNLAARFSDPAQFVPFSEESSVESQHFLESCRPRFQQEFRSRRFPTAQLSKSATGMRDRKILFRIRKSCM